MCGPPQEIPAETLEDIFPSFSFYREQAPPGCFPEEGQVAWELLVAAYQRKAEQGKGRLLSETPVNHMTARKCTVGGAVGSRHGQRRHLPQVSMPKPRLDSTRRISSPFWVFIQVSPWGALPWSTSHLQAFPGLVAHTHSLPTLLHLPAEHRWLSEAHARCSFSNTPLPPGL